ncbi:MAG: uroporphyrinogen-III synthase [Pseudomonadota bacterium]
MSERRSPIILVVRPEPGLAATLEAARELGLNAIGHALSQIRPLDWECPDPARFDALLIGSANAIRHGGPALEKLKDKPVYAVGKATAQVTQAAGFTVAMRGEGGLQKVIDAAPTPIRFLRIAGFEHVPLALPQGVSMIERLAYESQSIALDPQLLAGATEPIIALLHSASTAEHFAAECDRLGISRARVALAALGPRIVSGVGKGWAAIHTPEHPSDAALLAMVRELCQ